jgi:hypothetical protein
VSALFSDDGLYRYTLTRDTGVLGMEDTTVTFVGLNPSTADATKDDPTIRRCIRFVRDWGYGRLKVVNLYAYRATEPRDLWLVDDPVGPENDHYLSLAFGGSDLIVAAWGASAGRSRIEAFSETFDGWPLHCLGCTKEGFPRHPLYVRATQQPQPFNDVAIRVRSYR